MNSYKTKEEKMMLNPHTDGKFYDCHDMVRAGSSNCKGCSACCQNMGDSIVIDPLDAYRLCGAMQLPFEKMIGNYIALGVVNGMILPHLKMTETNNCCGFLENGRCSIHEYRPGLCRLFPLGRNYEDGKLNYILLKDTCNRDMVKVKVADWIGEKQIRINQKFIVDWHYFVKNMQQILNSIEETEKLNQINMYLLHQFYLKPYDHQEDFYTQFYERLEAINKVFL